MHNFASRISGVATASPQRPAIELLRDDGRVETTTYGELDDLAARIGAWLIAQGVGAGDRAAILADNDARWIAAYLGTLRIGAVAVPLDTAYKAGQVGTVLKNSGARVIFTTLRHLDAARGGVALVEGHGPTVALLAGEAPGVVAATAFNEPRDVPAIADVPREATAVILYTSGTTADPKGVVLTHGNLDAERDAAFAVVDVTAADAILGVLPLFHALAQMANLLLPLAVGARVVFLETVSSSALIGALSARRISIFACVPQFFYLIHQRVMAETAKRGALARAFVRAAITTNIWLRDHLRWNPGRRLFARVHRLLGPAMRLFITGGSKFDPGIGRDLYGLGFTILNAYGLTETSGGATVVRPGDRFTESVGHPFPGVEVSIAPPDTGHADDPEESKHDGEVLIRGPIIMREYFNRPDATADALRDGWLYTGDLGRLDEAGRLYITGRKKEIIVLSSGKNLYPEEIEAHYRQSLFIKELCVLGLSRPGEPASERLHAVVVPDEQVMRDKGIVNLRELLRFEIEGLSVKLPAHKRILSYDIWLEPLPRTTTGKIRRHEIQRRLREHSAAAVEDATPLTDDARAWLTPAHAETLALVARRLDRPGVRPDANLELDLGLDSMERVELLTFLEQRQGSRVAGEVRVTIFTVRQLVDAIEAAPSASELAPRGEVEGDLPWDALLATPIDPALERELTRPKLGRAIVLFMIAKLAGVAARVVLRFRVTGVRHLPASGPFIISPNHQAYLDPFLLSAALPFRTFRQLFFVGAAEYFETPLRLWFARAVNLIPVNPDANLVSAMQAGAAGLRFKKVLVLFPEGERTIDGELKKFRKGAAILSAHLDAPIVPVALEGLYELWPRMRPFNWRGLLPWRVRPVSFEFGPVIQVSRGAYSEGTADLRTAVAAMFARLRERR